MATTPPPPSTFTVPVTATAPNGRAVIYTIEVKADNTFFQDPQIYYTGVVEKVVVVNDKGLSFPTIPQNLAIAIQATPLATITAAVAPWDPVAKQNVPLTTLAANQLVQHAATGRPDVVAVSPSVTSIQSTAPTKPGATTTTAVAPSDNPLPTTQSNIGPVIGAAIGCLIAGLLVGFLIAFFIYKKRSQRQAQYATPPTVVESKGFDAPPPLPVVDDKLSRFLLDVSPDKEISSELRSLGTLIQQHVENNYHLNPVQADPRSLASLLTQLGVTSNGNGLPQEVVANLALDPRTRQVALQHVISQVLFTSIDVSSRSRLSMLPAPIAAFLQSIPPRESGERNNEVLATALNQWRALSAFILHPSRSQRTPLPVSAAAVSPQASSLADALNSFLHYFVDDSLRFQQTSHLQAVITECSKFGYVLLSQPHEWRLVNEPGPGHHSGHHGYSAVVCAGLVKVTLKDGTPTSSPQQVVPPMTVTV